MRVDFRPRFKEKIEVQIYNMHPSVERDSCSEKCVLYTIHLCRCCGMCVFMCVGTLKRVHLKLSGIRLPFGHVDTFFEDTVAKNLHQVLTFVSIRQPGNSCNVDVNLITLISVLKRRCLFDNHHLHKSSGLL